MATSKKKKSAIPAWRRKKGGIKGSFRKVNGQTYKWSTARRMWVKSTAAARKKAERKKDPASKRRKVTTRRRKVTTRRKNVAKKSSKKALPAAYFKKGKVSSKTIGGKKHVWRKGYTTKAGKRVRGRWVIAAKKSSRRKTSKRRRNSKRSFSKMLKRVRRRNRRR